MSANNVRKIREALMMSKAELARKSGLSTPEISAKVEEMLNLIKLPGYAGRAGSEGKGAALPPSRSERVARIGNGGRFTTISTPPPGLPCRNRADGTVPLRPWPCRSLPSPRKSWPGGNRVARNSDRSGWLG